MLVWIVVALGLLVLAAAIADADPATEPCTVVTAPGNLHIPQLEQCGCTVILIPGYDEVNNTRRAMVGRGDLVELVKSRRLRAGESIAP